MKPIIEYIKFKRLKELDLSDLRTIRKTEWSNPYKIESFLMSKGYVKSPPGAYGAVYSKPDSNVVLKLTTSPDPAWYKFYQYAVQNKGNKHLPKFGKMQIIDKKYYIIPIEKLNSFADNALVTLTDHINFGFNHLSYYYSLSNVTVDDFLNRSEKIQEIFDMKSFIDKSRVEHFYNAFEKLYDTYPLFVKTLVDLLNVAVQNNFDFDLHRHNIMQRSDGTLVVIDPFDVPGD